MIKNMKGQMKKINSDKMMGEIIQLDKESRETKISSSEKIILDMEQRFESTYYSNKFEGNKLSKVDARKAILME
jgi:hypothetical protein